MPAWLREKAEAVARGKCRADAPARRRGACFQGRRRPQQQKRQAGIGGGEMQPLAGFQIERVDQAGDGGGRRRAHRFLHGPQGFLAVGGLDHDQPGRIETERVEAMTMQPAMGAVGAQSVDRQDEDERVSPRQAGENRGDEAEGRRDRGFRLGHDLMQGAAAEATFRQMRIDGGKAQGKGFALLPHPGHEPAQLCHHGGAVTHQGRRGRLNRIRLGEAHDVESPLDIHCMFWTSDIRTKQEQCQGPNRADRYFIA
jgi:hypothetical protein